MEYDDSEERWISVQDDMPYENMSQEEFLHPETLRKSFSAQSRTTSFNKPAVGNNVDAIGNVIIEYPNGYKYHKPSHSYVLINQRFNKRNTLNNTKYLWSDDRLHFIILQKRLPKYKQKGYAYWTYIEDSTSKEPIYTENASWRGFIGKVRNENFKGIYKNLRDNYKKAISELTNIYKKDDEKGTNTIY